MSPGNYSIRSRGKMRPLYGRVVAGSVGFGEGIRCDTYNNYVVVRQPKEIIEAECDYFVVVRINAMASGQNAIT